MVNQGRALHDAGTLRSLYKGLVFYHDDHKRYPLSQSRGSRENNYDWDTWMIKIAYYFNDSFDKRNISIQDKQNFVSAHNDVDITKMSPWNENRLETNFGTIEGFMPWRANSWNFHGLVSTDIKRPQQFVALMDTEMRPERNNTGHYMTWGKFRSWWWHTWTWCDSDKVENRDVTIPINDLMNYIDFRQNNKNNFIFADGHVESLDPFDVKFKYFTNQY